MKYTYKEIAKDFKELYNKGKEDGINQKTNYFKEFIIRFICWLGGFAVGFLLAYKF